ncbi:MAG: hypothetical protein ACJAW4_002567 [Paracoccaceae bacterium]|jgi:hypothetical protein
MWSTSSARPSRTWPMVVGGQALGAVVAGSEAALIVVDPKTRALQNA